MNRWAILGLALVAGGLALERYGRSRMRAELAPLGDGDGAEVAASLSVKDALAAGARALVGRPALPQTDVSGGS